MKEEGLLSSRFIWGSQNARPMKNPNVASVAISAYVAANALRSAGIKWALRPCILDTWILTTPDPLIFVSRPNAALPAGHVQTTVPPAQCRCRIGTVTGSLAFAEQC